jgi:hypothetical protein
VPGTGGAVDLAVTDQWFYASGDGLYDYGGIVENHGEQTATGFIEIDVDFFDASGALLSTEPAFVDMAAPGARTPFTSILVEPAAEPVRMQARVSDQSFIDSQPGPQGQVSVADVTVRDDGFVLDVAGTATSSFDVDLDYVQLVAVWRDGGGTVVFAATGFLERLPGGSTQPFTISAFGDGLPSTPPTEILVAP